MSESKFYVTLLIFAFVACNQDLEAPQKHHRVRRYLTFQNGTRILFRVNVKDNIYKVNQIFAHAYGFRANIDLLQPPKAHRFHHKVSRREIFATVEELMNQQGFDGRACIFKIICDSYEKPETPESGMFFKMFKIIFSHRHVEDYENVNIPKLLSSGCSYLKQHCPIDLLELAPYTDVV